MVGQIEKIVFLDRVSISTPIRAPGIPHEWHEYPWTAPEETISRLEGATIAIINRCPITADIVRACPTLRLVAVCATGYDLVDIAACEKQGVAVCNVRDWAISVPEHVFSLMLALRRRILDNHEAVMRGDWAKSPSHSLVLKPIPRALFGSTMGIIGYGTLAKRVAKIADGFGMKVIIAERQGISNPRNERVIFEEVIEQSDVLVLLCPLNDETRNMITYKELQQMKKTSILINCARGGIVNEAALANALRGGSIAGAGVDVLSQEPPKDGNVLVDSELPNLIITPHVAWASDESLVMVTEQLIGNIEHFVAGRPRNLVTSTM